MFGRIHHLLWALAGFLGVATVWADAGYLPQAGPIALRFRVPAPPVVEPAAPVAPPAPIALPPPPMPSKPPEPTNPPPMAVTNPPPVEYDAREAVSWPVIRPDTVVVPQMLIKYFTSPSNPASNAAASGVVTPLGFIPPPVATPPAPTPPPPSKPASPTQP